MSGNTALRKGITTTVIPLSIPIVIWLNDRVYSTYTVRGTSMEPALKNGDVLLVRKADFLPTHQHDYQVTLGDFRSGNYSSATTDDDDNDNDDDDNDDNSTKTSNPSTKSSSSTTTRFKTKTSKAAMITEDGINRARIMRMDESVGKLPPSWYTILSHPPNPLPGQVVVFQSPVEFPSVCHVKRVVALGGQRVRPLDRFRKSQSVPPYCLWVEGDNPQNSIDSNSADYGPVSKHLLLGLAEYIVWPPSRWGVVERKKPHVGRAWWT